MISAANVHLQESSLKRGAMFFIIAVVLWWSTLLPSSPSLSTLGLQPTKAPMKFYRYLGEALAGIWWEMDVTGHLSFGCTN